MVTGFLCLQIVCQLALLVEAISAIRVVVRILMFGVSLALLVLVPGRRLRHPATPFLIASMSITALNMFNPGTNSVLAGAAQLGIQLAILGPLFWVTRLRIDAATFRRTLALLFLFNAANAATGVLQVYFPGRFQPALSTAIGNMGEEYTNSLQFETATGERVFRPFGLTDAPGGAATGAFYAVLLGAGFLISSRGGLVRALSVGGIFLGVVSLYLCQVRAIALMLLVCLLAIAAVLALSGRLLRLTKLLAVVGGLAVLGIGWATSVGGDAAMARWNSLVEKDAADVYYNNRGYFLEGTLNYFVPEYPLGAGLGRYGMANAYFGDNSDPSRSSLWAEIQWTAWVFDGGVLVLLLYPLALLATALWTFRLALRREELGELWLWGTLIFAYDLGAIALTFSYPFFMSQAGMEFWLLNAALFGAFFHAARQAPRPQPHETLHPDRR
ncbi:MAG: hypothetical protein ACJ8AT_28530 [Hyalangium sp.]|uniref:hypothetical protein n=1 Tax=Hyalangium sp. TaxID=2028555 RepID=UPI00389A4D62